jgi:AcrR family transcriptional regulator
MGAPTPETASERRRQRQREDARRAILDATEALLIEQGIDAFSMRRLVERCGYTAPTIYHHFGDKKGLLETLLEERFQQMIDVVRRVKRSDDPVETLRSMSLACVRFGLRNPSRMQLLTMIPDPSDPPQSSVEARALIETPLMELERQGRLLARDTEEAFQCLWIAMHGLMSMLTTRPDYEWSKNLVRTSLDAMLRGLVLTENGRARGRAS